MKYNQQYNTHLVRHSDKAQSTYKNKVINYSYSYTILLTYRYKQNWIVSECAGTKLWESLWLV